MLRGLHSTPIQCPDLYGWSVLAWVHGYGPEMGKESREGRTSALLCVCSPGKCLCPRWEECRKEGCPKWGAKLWGSLSPSLFQAPQESHYLQFSSTNVNGKAVIICLAEAGQAWMSAGPVRVSLHLSHTLLEADSQLAITTAGPIISALQEHAPLVTPPSSPTCPSAVDH